GYAQKDPKQEYKRESFELFSALLDTIKSEVARTVFTVRIQSQEELEQASEQIEEELAHLENVRYQHDEFGGEGGDAAEASAQRTRALAGLTGNSAAELVNTPAGMPKVGRNDPCPCGSGKKY